MHTETFIILANFVQTIAKINVMQVLRFVFASIFFRYRCFHFELKPWGKIQSVHSNIHVLHFELPLTASAILRLFLSSPSYSCFVYSLHSPPLGYRVLQIYFPPYSGNQETTFIQNKRNATKNGGIGKPFHSSEKSSFAACDWTNDFHVWKASFATSHWLELICVRIFTPWIFREYASVCIQ